MKKLIIAAVAMIGMAAQAEATGPAWICELDGTLSGKSIGIILDVTNIEGVGTISCKSVDGDRKDVPVRLKIQGVGVGLGYTEYQEIQVATANIGVADGPEALVGTYSVGPSAGVTLIEAGIDVGYAIKVAKEGGLSFEVAFVGSKARGLQGKIELRSFEIMPLE